VLVETRYDFGLHDLSEVAVLLRTKSNLHDVERVLIYRLGSLGDTVVALPCFRQIARRSPNAQRCLLTNIPVVEKVPSAKDILDGWGLVHKYLPYPVQLRSVAGLFQLWRQIHAFSPQVAIYLAAPRGAAQVKRDKLFLTACGVRHLIGVPDSPDLQTNRWLEDRRVTEPEAERLARCLHELGPIDLNDPQNWDLGLSTEEHAKARDVVTPLGEGRFLAVSVGTKMQSKDWGLENWSALLERMGAEYPQYGLAMVGAPSEFEISERAAEHWGRGYVNLCGRLTPRETAAVLAKAILFLGHDSGPMHLAAAVQTPCVAVFAATRRPAVWFPYGAHHRVIYHDVPCANCWLSECIENRKRCIASVTVDEMMQATVEQLAMISRKEVKGSGTTRPALRILDERKHERSSSQFVKLDESLIPFHSPD
jgi:ADP-heptose:LPS heptosyltransferase